VHSLQLRKVHGEEKSIVERNTKNTKWNVDSDLRHGEISVALSLQNN